MPYPAWAIPDSAGTPLPREPLAVRTTERESILSIWNAISRGPGVGPCAVLVLLLTAATPAAAEESPEASACRVVVGTGPAS